MPHDSTLDPKAILTALGVANVTAITPVQGGMDTSLWRVEHDSTTSALRVFRADQAAVCHGEVAAMEVARQAQLPVPAVQATGVWRDRPALLLSWSPGIPLWEALRQQPGRLWTLGTAFGRTQAQIHQLSSGIRHPQQRSDWIEWAGPQDQRFQTALRQIARPAPALLHLDYHPLNVLTDGTHMTAVLDWANSRAGDPRADVARTYTILMLEPFGPGQQPLAISLARRILAWSWRRGYEQVAGKLHDMDWFYVWAGAVMARDLAPRVSNPELWWQPEHLERIKSWTAARRRRAERAD